MGEGKAVTRQVIVSALILTPFLVPFWYIVGVFHFGFVSGPDPSLPLWIRYMVFSLPPAALLFAIILRSQVAHTGRSIGFPQAFLTAVVSLGFIQASEGIITLYQFGGDEIVFLGGLTLSFCSAILLTKNLSVSLSTSTQRR